MQRPHNFWDLLHHHHHSGLVGDVAVPVSARQVVLSSVREYVFYVFFRFQKNMTFYVFLK